MKAIIATAAGILGLGGLVVAGSGRATQSANTPGPTVVSSDRAVLTSGSTVVDCGEGRQAVVQPSASGAGASRVECVPVAPAQPLAVGMPYAQAYTAQFAPAAPATVVEERIVYRDRPVTRTVARRARTSSAGYSSSAPVYREAPRRTRSWKKSAVIIGGATAGGAGVGAVLGGKSGAKKGAVVGLVGGTVYDIATRNK
jgi:hypothetical protein